MSNLMEQAQQGGGAPPASQADIASIPKKKVDEEMLGENGKAECTICMDEVKLGQEVSEMYCQHWFHTHCIEAWVSEHDSCPHCRKTTAEGREDARKKDRTERRERRTSVRRRSDNASAGTSASNSTAEPSGFRDRFSRMFGNGGR
jgi:hypothetical protein